MKNLLNISTALLIITSAFAQAPDTASAVRELPDDRTYFSKTFYNTRDNTYVTRVSAGYVHYLASDGRFKNIDTKLKLDQSGAYYVIDSGLYNVAFAAAIGTGNWDVAYEVPRPVHPKVDNPGKPPAPVTRIRWKMLSYGYFDQSRNRYQVIDYARSVTPVLSSDQRQATSNQITYPQIFSGIDARYLCQNTGVKEEIVLSQSARNALPDPARYGLSRNNSYFVVAMEFLLTPNNINVFARRQGNKTPIKQGNDFVFNGDEAIEFEDENTTLHFFFPKDYAHAVADSVTDFANRANLKRVFYSQNGKHYLLVGVPWAWINSSPAGDLIIDPTTNAATNEDVRLYDAGNYGSDTKLAVGKFPNTGQLKSRSIINFNLASIPSNATVLNAQMKLKYYEAYNNVTGTWVDRWIQAHQLLVGWDEAQADSLHRSNGVNWGAPRGKIGGANPDANGTYESTLLFVQDEALPVWKNWDLTALTQKWISGSAANYGVLLWTTSEDTSGYVLRFYSSEAANTSDRPYLEVIWSNTPQTVYFLKDHLGSIRAAVSDSGKAAAVIGYDDYDAWGYPLATRSKPIPTAYLQGASKIKFAGKEYDDEFGLNVYHFDWRPYDPLIGRWWVHDPVDDYYSPYVYVRNNPVRFFDADGKSTVTDSTGKVIQVDTKDKDLSVYRTSTVTGGVNELGIEGGARSVKEKVGETEFIDEFEVGNELDFSKGAIDNEVEALQLNYVIGSDPASVAFNSLPGKPLDVKANGLDSRRGFLYDGLWMTGRSVGNRLAGKNAAILGKSYAETIAVAGLLHMLSNREIGSLRYLGEVPYAGRQIQSGYKSVTGVTILDLWKKKTR